MTSRDDRKSGKAPELTSKASSELDPFEIEFLPEFEEGRGPREPFVNQHGVLIGDHEYASEHSPLEEWSTETDPAIMAGDEWVHPYKDIGFHSAENKDYFERGIIPQGGIFFHPEQDVAYETFNGEQADTAAEANPDEDPEHNPTNNP